MSADPPIVCRRVIYSGRVQGVGFRWTTSRVAEHHAVAGFVRNLPDGTVELLAQGTASVVAAFLDEIAQTLSGNIESASASDKSVQTDLAGFTIRR